MKTLSKGENTPLESQTKTVSFSSLQQAMLIVKNQDEMNDVMSMEALDLQQLKQKNVSSVDVVISTQYLPNEPIQLLTDGVPSLFFDISKQRSEKAVILGRLYWRNNEWRFRVLDEGFNDGEAGLQRYYGITQPIFKSNIPAPIQQVADKVNEIRQSETGRAVEQNLKAGIKASSEIAQTVVQTTKNTFSTVMGDSDAVAQRQHQQERFKPLELQKMQSVPFKDARPKIENLHIGLGWKSKTGTGMLKGIFGGVKSVNVDLDLSVQLLSFTGEVVDTVYFDKVRSDNLAVNHYGDAAKGGNGLQDDEIISVALGNLPKNVAFIAITATSNKGHLFSGLESGYLHIVNQQAMLPLVQYQLDPTQAKSGCLLGLLSRNTSNEWEFIAIGDYEDAAKIQDLETKILHWAKFVGQARGIVPRDAGNLLPNHI